MPLEQRDLLTWQRLVWAFEIKLADSSNGVRHLEDSVTLSI